MQFILRLLIISQCVYSLQAILNQTMISSLKNLYDQTNGPSWTVHTGALWNFSTAYSGDPCVERWTGLRCNSNNNTIVDLYLESHNLQGEFKSDVFNNFGDLIVLSLQKNRCYSLIKYIQIYTSESSSNHPNQTNL